MHRCPSPKPGNPRCRRRSPRIGQRLFTQHLNAGDLDAVMVPVRTRRPLRGAVRRNVVGRDRIRDGVGRMIEAKRSLESRVIKTVTVGDIALLYTDFEGTTVEASGKTVRSATRRSRSCAASPTAPGSSSWATRTAAADDIALTPKSRLYG